MTLVMRLLPPLKQLSQTPTTAQQSFAAAERLFDVLDQPSEPEKRSRHARRLDARARRRVRRRDVRLRDEPVLRDISFTRRKGRRSSRSSGPSGAGKSTLVDLHSALLRADTAGVSCSTASIRARSRCRRCAR